MVSIEPDAALYAAAKARFAGIEEVTLINATSAAALPRLLPALSGPVTFWLDGHYSGGTTYRGEVVTPIAVELDAISRSRDRMSGLVVLVDDVRLFGVDDGYPPFGLLYGWAEAIGWCWHVEHDIIVMRGS